MRNVFLDFSGRTSDQETQKSFAEDVVFCFKSVLPGSGKCCLLEAGRTQAAAEPGAPHPTALILICSPSFQGLSTPTQSCQPALPWNTLLLGHLLVVNILGSVLWLDVAESYIKTFLFTAKL